MIPPLVAAGIPAAATVAGNFISSAFNAWQASKNRRFQGDMSSTAHQREVADLRKAGLNPILSVSKGGPGASTPSGSTAQAVSHDVGHSLLARNQSALQTAQIREHNSAAALKESEKQDLDYTRLLRYAEVEAQLALIKNQVYKSDVSVTRPSLRALQQQILADSRTSSAHAISAELGLSGDRARSRFQSGVGGKIEPWAKLLPNMGVIPQFGLKIPHSAQKRHYEYNYQGR